MATTLIMAAPLSQFFDSNSVELANGQIFTYAAGTVSKISVYTDNTGTTVFTNPIKLNSRGEPTYAGASTAIWLTPGTAYKFVLSPSTDTDPPTNAFYTTDNIVFGVSAGPIQTVADTGALNALVVTLTPSPGSYSLGTSFFVKPANTTTGAVTINVNSLGVKNVTLKGAALNSGAMQAGQLYLLNYDGTQFELESVPGGGNWVANSDMATMAAFTFKGNNTASPAAPQDVTLAALLSETTFPGQYGFFAFTPPPANWLLCDGSSYSTTTYANLFAVIGYTYGGSGASFKVPDFKTSSPFMRGYNALGPGAALGTLQLDAFQGHFHTHDSSLLNTYGRAVSGGGTGIPSGVGANEPANVGAPVTDGSNGTPRTATETRPVNLAVVVAIHV